MLLQLSSLTAAVLGLKSEREAAEPQCMQPARHRTATLHQRGQTDFKGLASFSSPHFGPYPLVASYYYTNCYAMLCYAMADIMSSYLMAPSAGNLWAKK